MSCVDRVLQKLQETLAVVIFAIIICMLWRLLIFVRSLGIEPSRYFIVGRAFSQEFTSVCIYGKQRSTEVDRMEELLMLI